VDEPDGTTRAFTAILGRPEPGCIDTDLIRSDESDLHIIGLAEWDIWEVEIQLIRKVGTNPPRYGRGKMGIPIPLMRLWKIFFER
jgi:hypothetical protein